jgi:class 3 adenylate cyclase
VVSVLFVALVGFTSRSEQADPEDVRATLRPYHERAKADIERHGGTVEKFIGDAVMALFGAPVGHEDDPERAVRAALAIRDFADDEGLRPWRRTSRWSSSLSAARRIAARGSEETVAPRSLKRGEPTGA